MEEIKLSSEEIQQITIIVGMIQLPEVQPVSCDIVGCKGCEGGCAAELCAK